jgi:MFS family permease
MVAAHRWPVVSSLGIVQILAWGSSYSLVAVLGSPSLLIPAGPLPWVVGAISLALACAGMASPPVGRLIARHGGRPVLTAGCCEGHCAWCDQVITLFAKCSGRPTHPNHEG